MGIFKGKEKAPAEVDPSVAYAAAAEPFRKAVALACDFAAEAGLTDHQIANELWTIAQASRDGKRERA